MGKSVNVATFSGNLGKAPEVTYTPSGSAVCKFSVAVNDRKKDKDGTYADVATWIRVTCFGKTAEACGQYLDKGRPVLVTGKLEVDVWKDKEGKERTSVGLIANDVVFLGGGKGEGAPAATPAPAAGASGFIDDELPF